MTLTTKPLARSNQLAVKLMFAALCHLRDEGGTMRGRELIAKIPSLVVLDSWANEVLESNSLTRWQTYTHFFSVDAVKAGFLQKNKGYWTLTPSGAQALELGELGYFRAAQAAYRVWRDQQLSATTGGATPAAAIAASAGAGADAEAAPPEEQIDQITHSWNSRLSADLLERVRDNSWQFFERLVVDVLKAMGYGGVDHAAQAFQTGGDGGVDGFIHLDRLGLDVVYVQAKRWAANQPVGRPDIQQFVGALAGRQATRGVFITTSRFTADARQYVQSLNVRVILLDGEQLAKLMIDYGVGVSTWKSVAFKRLDNDFFAED